MNHRTNQPSNPDGPTPVVDLSGHIDLPDKLRFSLTSQTKWR